MNQLINIMINTDYEKSGILWQQRQAKYLCLYAGELRTENMLSYTTPWSPNGWGNPAWSAKWEPGK